MLSERAKGAAVTVMMLVAWAGALAPLGCRQEEPQPMKAPEPPEGTILLDGPAVLDKENAVYFLTTDVIADGTAFTVETDGVTLDLGGHTVVYNARPSDEPVYGVRTVPGRVKHSLGTGVNGLTLRNGRIIQGAGASKLSPAVALGGQFRTGYNIHHLDIRVHGEECVGISASINDSKVHHNYVESRATTKRLDGGNADAMSLSASLGGLDVYRNIIAGGHRGIKAGRVATYGGTYLQRLGGYRRSKIHENLIQNRRMERGVKAPYGIALWGSQMVDVFGNEVASDNARGIIFDMGAKKNSGHHNLIDVQYSRSVAEGAYVENRVYGFRVRYRSGQCKVHHNRIFVNNGAEGAVAAVFVGSDNKDPQLDGIELTENEIHAEGGTRGWPSEKGSAGLVLDAIDNVRIERNRITADGCPVVIRREGENVVIDGNVLLQPARGAKWTAAVTNMKGLKFTGKNTTAETPADRTAPAPPSDLQLTRHLDAVVLRWTPNEADTDVRGYIVYRDGKRLPISPRAGTFTIDLDVPKERAATYAVSAVDFSGNEGKKCRAVSTKRAFPGWNYAAAQEEEGE